MIKQEITYDDAFTGQSIAAPFYFHLNKAELLRIIGRSGNEDWEDYVNEIVASGNNDRVMDFIESVIKASVGERTEDGKFIKNSKIADEFIASEAYGELFVLILDNKNKFTEKFFSGIIGEKTKAANNKSRNNLEAVAGNRQQRRNKGK